MRRFSVLIVAFSAFFTACTASTPETHLILLRADRTISGKSVFPTALDSDRVGTYSSETKSGAGYFYDNVLEYRVWHHPEHGAKPWNGANDYYVAFAQYEQAEKYAKETLGTEAPLALVRQLEWIDEPEPGHYVPKKGERMAEWQVKWLPDSKRTENSIRDFLAHPRPQRIEPDDASDYDPTGDQSRGNAKRTPKGSNQ